MKKTKLNNLAIATLPVSALGRKTIFLIRELGRIAVFFVKGFLLIFSFPLQISKTIEQIYFIGMKSVLVICLTGAFTAGYWCQNLYSE